MLTVRELIELINKEQDWYKKTLLIAAFHSIQQTHFGTTRGKGWTINKTALALSMSTGFVSESIQLAISLTSSPELKDCRNREQALIKIGKIK